MPEVHLATALMVSAAESEDVSPLEARALRRNALVRYPGKILRYAEAKGELDFARSEAKNRGSYYPFRSPWFAAELEALEGKLSGVYPYAVKFSPDPEAQIVFENTTGRSLDLIVAGPEGFEEELELAPAATRKVVVPDPGLVRLSIGGKRKTFLGESYAVVTVPL
jgi:hypothetical protein